MRMKNMLVFAVLVGVAVILIVALTGCGKKTDFIDGVETQISTQMGSAAGISTETSKAVEHSGTFRLSNLPEYWYNVGVYAKRWAPMIIVASMVLGGVIYDIFKKNREVQKWAFDLLVIRIPLITFVLVYLYAFLYRMLNL